MVRYVVYRFQGYARLPSLLCRWSLSSLTVQFTRARRLHCVRCNWLLVTSCPGQTSASVRRRPISRLRIAAERSQEVRDFIADVCRRYKITDFEP